MDCAVSDLPVSASTLVEALLSVPDVLVVVLDPDGTVRYVNPAVESTTGYEAQELRETTLWETLAPSNENKEVRRCWKECRDSGAVRQYSHHVCTQTGDRRYVEWRGIPLKDEASSVLGVGIDRTQYRQLEKEILTVSESERRRIGQELHDGLASELIAATIRLENLRSRIEQNHTEIEDLLDRLQNVETTVRQGAQQARSLSHLLVATSVRPEGVPRALSELTDKQQQVSNTPCRLHLPDQELPEVPNAVVAGHLYRIAQEAVRNAVTHANASHVDLYLGVGVDQASQEEATDSRETEASENIILRVEDDGRGMPEAACETLTGASGQEGGAGVETDASNPGIGLHLMQYRADLIGARLTVESTDGEGTTVTCEVPLGTEGG